MELSKRKLRVLAVIVQTYISTGEPVGSKSIASELDASVSSATIRNDMAELTELGLILQPHTSAGRVPSQAGYRLYIDRLMNKSSISNTERSFIDEMISGDYGDPVKVLERASVALAQLTNMAALATTPSSGENVVEHIEFLPVNRSNAIILVLTSGRVTKSKLCHFDFDVLPEHTEAFYKFAEKFIIGEQLSKIDLPFIQTMIKSVDEYTFSLIPVFMELFDVIKEAGEAEIKLKGQTNLLMHPEFSPSRAHMLFDFLAQRERIMSIIGRRGDGVSVVLGGEMDFSEMQGSSLLLAKYHTGNQSGSLGVIGPIRMDYAKLIPNLEYFAFKLGKLLSEINYSSLT